MALYLGLDASTQSLSAIVLDIEDRRREVVLERTLVYDEACPAYGTRHGVLPDPDPLVAAAPPLLWADALDRVMALLAADRSLDWSRLRAVAGSAQQHGSVYLNDRAGRRLGALDPARPLAPQLEDVFARPVAPIWMDASTGAACRAITEAAGGPEALARLTGSRAFERFTGPQIRGFVERDPEGYARTDRIHLVSSFHASLLAGRHAPVEPGDASGMNLMDLARRAWAPAALNATAPDLARRLPAIVPSWTVAGPLARYWTARYGLPAARVVAWSGDNPCSLIGTGLVREGRVTVSLGTSDTIFGFMREPRIDPSFTGHVFGSPTGDFMGLTCFRNGSLARERVRQERGLDWEGFSAALRATPAGNGGALCLPWFEPEITPPVDRPGARFYGFDGPPSAAAHVRAVVEGQMLAMARHSRWMGVTVDRIHATGGAAANRALLEVLADVFGAEVYRLRVANSAALGAALRAYHADLMADGHPAPWEEVIAGFVEPFDEPPIRPRRAHTALYADLAPVHAACEAHALGRGPDPTPLLQAFRSRAAAR